MVTFNIAVKTSDRSPRKNFLEETLRNFERAGGLSSKHLASLTIVDSSERTLHENAQTCIEFAGLDGASHAMVLEDDLDFCDGFLESAAGWIEDHPGHLMYVLGANYEQIEGRAARGERYWSYPVGAFYGAQALVWPQAVAAELAAWLGPHPAYNGCTDHGHDLLLQQWGKKEGLTHFLASAPCMVQHIGNESGIGNRFFQFPWGGRSWRYAKRGAA